MKTNLLKKILLILLAIITSVLSVAGCSAPNGDNGDKPPKGDGDVSYTNFELSSIDPTEIYKYNEIIPLTSTAKNQSNLEVTVSATYEVTSGNAVVFKDGKGNWFAKPGLGESKIKGTFNDLSSEVLFVGEEQSFMLFGGSESKGIDNNALLKAYTKNNSDNAYNYTYYNGRYSVDYNSGETNYFEIKDEYKSYLNIDGYLYIDLFYGSDSVKELTIDVNGVERNNWFDSKDSASSVYDSMKDITWKWYDLNGDEIVKPVNDENYLGRWFTLEIPLSKSNENNDFIIKKPVGETGKIYISSIVVSKKQLIKDKWDDVIYLMNDYSQYINYWEPAGKNSKFTWCGEDNLIGGRQALKYESLTTNCSALTLAKAYCDKDYRFITKEWDYIYIDLYVPEDMEWTRWYPISWFKGYSPTYIVSYSNWQMYEEERARKNAAAGHPEIFEDLPWEYQWAVEDYAIGTGPSNYKGEWVTLELYAPNYDIDENLIEYGDYKLSIEKYSVNPNFPDVWTPLGNDMYISNVRFATYSLLK